MSSISEMPLNRREVLQLGAGTAVMASNLDTLARLVPAQAAEAVDVVKGPGIALINTAREATDINL